jgi:dihydrofolate reductase
VFVVTHREREVLERKGGTSFTFVTDGIESAVTQAKAAAAHVGKDVAVAGGGRLVRQVLAEGLLDRLDLHIVPVVLGDGLRLLDPALGLDPREAIELTPTRVIATPDVTHIRYAVEGRAPLVLDDRGSGRPIDEALSPDAA